MKKPKKAASHTARGARKSPGAAGPADSGSDPGPASLSLPADCMVADAAALKESLAGLIGDSRPVRLNVAALQRIDTAAMQLLAAFVRDRDQNGLRVEWQGTAPSLSTAARLLGLTSVLKLPA
ncbi:MAG TPA: STAS domain-containing protein [Steroidobacteraceae bacterium]|nr:STAS domain-containing protein [Steroidobacteraceae bacterium]